MPILNVHIRGRVKTPAGDEIELPAAIGLLRRGPCVQATVRIAEPIAKELLE